MKNSNYYKLGTKKEVFTTILNVIYNYTNTVIKITHRVKLLNKEEITES